jgi:UDP-galactopyranose mutase
MEVDYLIIGSGLSGATLARLLVDAGRDVLVLERRGHVGGNVHDHTHESGIRIHTYGPHYFRTSSDRIWQFATRFAPFYRYEASLLSLVDGGLEQWPIAGSYIRRTVGDDWQPEFDGTPLDLEQAALSLMPRVIYEKFVKEYNEKQWGVRADALSPSLCTRFDVRHDDEPRLKPHCKYQGIPVPGYAAWMNEMLAGIPVLLNCDYLARRDDFHARKKVIYTGPIDAYFDYDIGRLHYRGQRREHAYHSDADYLQPTGQVNNPTHAGGPHIRMLEWKHMMERPFGLRIRGTVVTTETPYSPADSNEYEYPFPDEANATLYAEYRRRADAVDGLLVCGRLGEYRYFDMDQAIARAMMLASRIAPDAYNDLGERPRRTVLTGESEQEARAA